MEVCERVVLKDLESSNALWRSVRVFIGFWICAFWIGFFVRCQRFAESFQSEAESEDLLDFVLPKCSSWVFKVYHESPNVCKCFLEKFLEVCFKCS